MIISDQAQRAIEGVLEREGGYVNDPDDPGGATNMGITIRTLMDWRGVPVNPRDVEELDKDEAVRIYHSWYIEDPKIEQYLEAEWLFNYVFDMIVNHGAGNAIKILQAAACTIEDGILGPATAAAANNADPGTLKRALDRERMLFYVNIVIADNSKLKFLKGWTNRMFEVA